MEIETLKPFINHDVEILIAGNWVEGHMNPIVKGIITLSPVGVAREFYGPVCFKVDSVQAIRLIKVQPKDKSYNPPPVESINSSIEPITPGVRSQQLQFVRKNV